MKTILFVTFSILYFVAVFVLIKSLWDMHRNARAMRDDEDLAKLMAEYKVADMRRRAEAKKYARRVRRDSKED